MDAITEHKVYDGLAGRILEMLGNGLTPAIVATALGISESRISQLMSEEDFAQQVTERRFVSLQAASARDAKYDDMEDALLKKMQDLIPMMYKPMEVLRALTEINKAKRRGTPAAENVVIHNTIVQLNMPEMLVTTFQKNAANQIVSVGDKAMVTIPSGALSSQLAKMKGDSNDSTAPKTAALPENRAAAN